MNIMEKKRQVKRTWCVWRGEVRDRLKYQIAPWDLSNDSKLVRKLAKWIRGEEHSRQRKC